MFSKEKRTSLISSLTTAENADLIELLITDLSESDLIIAGAGTLTDEGETATFAPNEVEIPEPIADGFKEKFEALQAKYIDRFMNGESVEDSNIESVEGSNIESVEDSNSESGEDSKGENVSYDDVFDKKNEKEEGA